MSQLWSVQPLAFTWPWALAFWGVTFWAFMPEMALIRRARTSVKDASSPDAGSMRLILVGNQLASISAFVVAGWRATAIRPDWRPAAFGIGLLILISGSLLRRHCWRVLGEYFTGDVRARADQPVIQTGAYAWVRHPSYTGGLLMFFGTGLALGNWLSIVLTVGMGYLVYAYRVRVEERALAATIGEPYRRYMATHKRFIPFVLALVLAVAAADALRAQAVAGTTVDETVAPGANYDKAEFRLWYPDGVARVDAVVVLVPGSNGDGRPMAADPFWQAFAARHHLALLACRFTDKPHDQPFIEDYVNVSHGSGQALLDVLTTLAGRTAHAELANAPLLLWGMSAGGEFDYEFVAWKPERVIAFVVNKGGIYCSALTSKAARSVPGILFTGEKDLDSRIATITGLFALNRRGGALWALAQEPGAAHVVGRSREMGALLFEDVLPLRLGSADGSGGGPPVLRALTEQSGFIGDLVTHAVRPAAAGGGSNALTVWLPTERAAAAWQAVVTGKPFN